MVLRKITKKKFRSHTGGAGKEGKKEGDESADNAKIAATITDKNIKDFKNEDYPRGWIVHDLYLAAPVKTEKDYIKQAIVVKRKKVEKKKKEEKFSTVKGIETLKKSTGGLFSAIKKGITEGRQNFDRFMQGAESIKRGLTAQGKYGRQFSSQMGKARAQGKKARANYSKAKATIKKNKEQAIKDKNNELTGAMSSNPDFAKMEIKTAEELKSKINTIIQKHISPALSDAEDVLKNMGTSLKFKNENLKTKLAKIENVMKNYRDAKDLLLTDSDESNLFKLYSNKDNNINPQKRSEKKKVDQLIEESGLGQAINLYIKVVSQVYQLFLFLVATYVSLIEVDKDKEKYKEMFDYIEDRFSDNYEPKNFSWKKFYKEELDEAEKNTETSLIYLANNYQEKYYNSLMTIADKGLYDTTEIRNTRKEGNRDKENALKNNTKSEASVVGGGDTASKQTKKKGNLEKIKDETKKAKDYVVDSSVVKGTKNKFSRDKHFKFGPKKILVLYIALRLIPVAPVFKDLKTKSGFEHFKKAGCNSVPLIIDDYVKEINKNKKYESLKEVINQINGLIKTKDDQFEDPCEGDIDTLERSIKKRNTSLNSTFKKKDVKTSIELLKRKNIEDIPKMNVEELNKLNLILQKTNENDAKKYQLDKEDFKKKKEKISEVVSLQKDALT